MQLKVKKLHPDAILPKYQTAGAACFDLHAVMKEPWTIIDGGVLDIPTGLAFEVPEGHVMLIYSRSGHGFKNNVRLSNCVGVIDSDYRGELRVKLTHDGTGANGYTAFRVETGDRIAQAMIIPVQQVQLVEVDELGTTGRGVGGMGSTGA